MSVIFHDTPTRNRGYPRSSRTRFFKVYRVLISPFLVLYVSKNSNPYPCEAIPIHPAENVLHSSDWERPQNPSYREYAPQDMRIFLESFIPINITSLFFYLHSGVRVGLSSTNIFFPQSPIHNLYLISLRY